MAAPGYGESTAGAMYNRDFAVVLHAGYGPGLHSVNHFRHYCFHADQPTALCMTSRDASTLCPTGSPPGWPGLATFLLVLSLNPLRDELRNSLDPRHASQH
jgi:hypothetical protein